jgi:16S rRNA (guanine966-N2)-methyltransferase
MHITSGKYKNKRINVPTGEIRPTQGILRMAIFNFLDDFLKDASVLDLFAGTGAFGIEALSRGARKVVFVDITEKAVLTIKANIEPLGIKDATAVYKMDALTFLVKSIRKHRKFDIIFIDPPYSKLYKMKNEMRDNYLVELIDRAKALLNSRSIIIVKHPKKVKLNVPQGLEIAEQRHYGINMVTYFVQTEFLIAS